MKLPKSLMDHRTLILAFFCLSLAPVAVYGVSPALPYANINWNLLNSAQWGDNYRVILTTATANQHAATWAPCQIDLTHDFDLTFGMNFGTLTCGADGISFVLQSQGTAVCGGNSGAHAADIHNSVAIGFDTWSNPVPNYYDPPYDSLNIQVNADVDVLNAGPVSCGGRGLVSGPSGCARPPISSTAYNVKDGLDHTVEIKWIAASCTIQVFVDLDPTPRAVWILPSDYAASIFTNTSNVWWGFTAATGTGGNNYQEVGLVSGTINGATDATASCGSHAGATPVPIVIPPNYCGTPTNMPTFTITPTNSPYQSPTMTLTAYPTPCGGSPSYQAGQLLLQGQPGMSTSKTVPYNVAAAIPNALALIVVENPASQMVTSISFDGQPMTAGPTGTNIIGRTEAMYTLPIGFLSTGSKNVVLNFNNTANDNFIVTLFILGNVNQTTPLGAAPTSGTRVGDGAFSPSITPSGNSSLLMDFMVGTNGCFSSANIAGSQTKFAVGLWNSNNSGTYFGGDYVQGGGAGVPTTLTNNWAGSCGGSLSWWVAEIMAPNSCGTPSDSPTPSATLTVTATRTPPSSATSTLTATPTFTASPTPSLTSTRTSSPTPSGTLTVTPPPYSYTNTPSFTNSPTSSETKTPTPSASITLTASPSPTYTATPTLTPSSSITFTSTSTPTYTATRTPTPSSSITFTSTLTLTYTNSSTPSASASSTLTSTISPTPSASATITMTYSSTQTFTDSPTRTISPSITQTLIPMPMNVTVWVYNAAGEQVKQIYNGSMQYEPLDIILSSPVLALGVNGIWVQIPVSGTKGVYWDGTGASGQAVSDGVYWVKVEMHDNFNRTTSIFRTVTVMRTVAQNTLKVFNSTGEEVASVNLGAAGPGVAGIVDFQLSSNRVAFAYDPATGAATTGLSITLKDAANHSWTVPFDGRNSQGQPLASGVYTVQLINETNSRGEPLTQQVQILQAGAPGKLENLRLVPNPCLLKTKAVNLLFNPSPGTRVACRLYNLAGELMRQANVDGGAGKLSLDATALVEGVYVAVVEKTSPEGEVMARQVVKMAAVK